MHVWRRAIGPTCQLCTRVNLEDAVGHKAGQVAGASLLGVLSFSLLLCHMPHLHSPRKARSCFIPSFVSHSHSATSLPAYAVTVK